MKQLILVKQKATMLIVSIFMGLVVSGCGVDYSPGNYGKWVHEDNRTNLSDTGQRGLWQGRDLSLSYKTTLTQADFNISGTLFFDDSLLLSYPVVRDFYLKIYFLNRDGNVLVSKVIPINYSYGNVSDESYYFNLSTPLPPEVKSFAFSYNGTFSDYGEKDPDSIYIRQTLR